MNDEEFGRHFAGSFRGQCLRLQGELDQLEATICETRWGRILLRIIRLFIR